MQNTVGRTSTQPPAAGRGRGRARRRRRHVRAGREHLQGLEHRLGVLRLVLHHHLEREAVPRERVGVVAQVGRRQHIERPLPHVAEEGVGLAGRQQRRGAPVPPGRLGGVVELIELRVEGGPSSDAPHQPQLLVRRDVTEVPDGWAQQRAGLAGQVLVRERPEDPERPAARPLQPVGEHRSQRVHDENDGRPRPGGGVTRLTGCETPQREQPHGTPVIRHRHTNVRRGTARRCLRGPRSF